MWLEVIAMILALAPKITQTIQLEQQDAASGATKKQMATDALSGAISAATGVLPNNPATAALLALANQTISIAIDQAVAIGQAKGGWGKVAAVVNTVDAVAQEASTLIGANTTAVAAKLAAPTVVPVP